MITVKLSSIEFSTKEKKSRDTGEEEEAARRMNQGQANHNEVYLDDTGTSYYGKRETRGRKTVMYRADQ